MRTNHSAEEKARRVLEALRGESTISEIASEHNVHPNTLTRWKTQAVKGLPQIFESETKAKKQVKESEKEKEELYKQIGKKPAKSELTSTGFESSKRLFLILSSIELNDVYC